MYPTAGILWPLEGMPFALRQIAYFLPNTLPCQAMRDIMLRGWGIETEVVYLGVGRLFSVEFIISFKLYQFCFNMFIKSHT